MYKEITVSGTQIMNHQFEAKFELPSVCPHCNTGILPKVLASYYIEHSTQNTIYINYFCPSCEDCFLGQYTISHEEFYTDDTPEVDLLSTFPNSNLSNDFPDSIKLFSPNFSEIYDQSYKAEQSGLHEICGLGYRKSVEFLIKDYAISCNPDDAEDIKKITLSSCIQKYIDSSELMTLATKSTWIENDEAHYHRKHLDRDFKDLKKFIKAMVSFVDMQLYISDAKSIYAK